MAVVRVTCCASAGGGAELPITRDSEKTRPIVTLTPANSMR